MNASVARRIAEHAHKGQIDKAGEDYIRHPERIAHAMKAAGYGDPVIAVAWLHDVVEDTHITLDNLRQAGFSAYVVEAVDALSQRKKEPRDNYYGRVLTNRFAHIVKWYDMLDNADPERLAKLDPETQERLSAKYDAARERLVAPPLEWDPA